MKSNSTKISNSETTTDQTKTAYVVLELAYFDEFLSGVDVIGVFTSRRKASSVANDISIINTASQYTFKGRVYETIIM